jgi:hypothetical protein
MGFELIWYDIEFISLINCNKNIEYWELEFSDLNDKFDRNFYIMKYLYNIENGFWFFGENNDRILIHIILKI